MAAVDGIIIIEPSWNYFSMAESTPGCCLNKQFEIYQWILDASK